MKKITLILFLFTAKVSFSQILNPNFENWTYSLDSFGFSPYIPSDTFSYLKLVNWTSLNSITGNPAAGGKYLVNQSANSHSGAYAVQMNTDSIFIAGSLNQGMIAPGFIVNGNFQLNLAAIITSTGPLDPVTFAGAGSPLSQRVDKIGLWVKYTPIPGDSLLVWAVLKKAGAKIGECKLYSTQASSAYQNLQGSFNYFNCDIPDSVVVMIASSNPDFSTLLSGTSGLRPGSVLLVDSISLIPFPGGTSRPVVVNYSTHTFAYHPTRFTVAASDTDCTGHSLTFALAGTPSHGTATIHGDTVTYTPAPGFTGTDTVFFTASNGSYTTTGYVIVYVYSNTGIQTIDGESISVYPNPAKNTLTIVNTSVENGTAVISDILGRKTAEYPISANQNAVDISSFSPGTYFISVQTQQTQVTLKFIKE